MNTISLVNQLFTEARIASRAFSSRGKQQALYNIRKLVTEQSLELVLELDAQLQENEGSLNELDKEFMRRQGYQFPEDLDNVPELMRKHQKEREWE